MTKRRAGLTQGLPKGKEDLAWVANTVTLIYGEREAVLVDTSLSVEHSKELVDWLAESGKNLTTIYTTHAHGITSSASRLCWTGSPNARAFAIASTVAGMQNQIKPDFVRSFWELRFPGQLPPESALPEVLEGDTLYPEGAELQIVQLATRTPRPPSLCMYLQLIWSFRAMRSITTRNLLAECDEEEWAEWLSTLDKI